MAFCAAFPAITAVGKGFDAYVAVDGWVSSGFCTAKEGLIIATLFSGLARTLPLEFRQGYARHASSKCSFPRAKLEHGS
jgi:hypothetical protein